MSLSITVFPTDNSSLSILDPCHPQRAGHREKMADAIELEKVDEDGKPIKRLAPRLPRKPHQTSKRHVDTAVTENDESTDKDDQDYDMPKLKSPSDSDSDGDLSDAPLSNAEVWHLLSWHLLLQSRRVHCVGCRHSPIEDWSCHATSYLCKEQALNVFLWGQRNWGRCR
jgi:hypothetical protein